MDTEISVNDNLVDTKNSVNVTTIYFTDIEEKFHSAEESNNCWSCRWRTTRRYIRLNVTLT